MDAREQLIAAFPIRSDLVALELSSSHPEGDALVLTVRLVLFDGPAGELALRSMMEQPVRVRASDLADPRFAAFIQGWRLALTEVFAALSASGDLTTVEGLMPCDLVDLRGIELKRPQSADDFCDALLKPGRFGALLPPA